MLLGDIGLLLGDLRGVVISEAGDGSSCDVGAGASGGGVIEDDAQTPMG